MSAIPDWNVVGPELLAAIQGVMPTLERIEAAHQHAHPQQIQNVREAIAKATPIALESDDSDDYHEVDPLTGYSRADDEWFFDMDGKP